MKFLYQMRSMLIILGLVMSANSSCMDQNQYQLTAYLPPEKHQLKTTVEILVQSAGGEICSDGENNKIVAYLPNQDNVEGLENTSLTAREQEGIVGRQLLFNGCSYEMLDLKTGIIKKMEITNSLGLNAFIWKETIEDPSDQSVQATQWRIKTNKYGVVSNKIEITW